MLAIEFANTQILGYRLIWHPFLMSLDAELELEVLKFKDSDAGLLERAQSDPRLEISP